MEGGLLCVLEDPRQRFSKSRPVAENFRMTQQFPKLSRRIHQKFQKNPQMFSNDNGKGNILFSGRSWFCVAQV
jgi:hypothetical protein